MEYDKLLKKSFILARKHYLSETFHLSIEKQDDMHRKFIIDLGEEIVPFLMWDLKYDPCHWFCVLEEILGKQPVITHDNRGRLNKMCELWLDFLSELGHSPEQYKD